MSATQNAMTAMKVPPSLQELVKAISTTDGFTSDTISHHLAKAFDGANTAITTLSALNATTLYTAQQKDNWYRYWKEKVLSGDVDYFDGEEDGAFGEEADAEAEANEEEDNTDAPNIEVTSAPAVAHLANEPAEPVVTSPEQARPDLYKPSDAEVELVSELVEHAQCEGWDVKDARTWMVEVEREKTNAAINAVEKDKADAIVHNKRTALEEGLDHKGEDDGMAYESDGLLDEAPLTPHEKEQASLAEDIRNGEDDLSRANMAPREEPIDEPVTIKKTKPTLHTIGNPSTVQEVIETLIKREVQHTLNAVDFTPPDEDYIRGLVKEYCKSPDFTTIVEKAVKKEMKQVLKGILA
jgi:hypothetical protein|tara:strand:- start:18694 stop:19755 length:1062 start_codon:yes stop_codon:yes gene_type:complete